MINMIVPSTDGLHTAKHSKPNKSRYISLMIGSQWCVIECNSNISLCDFMWRLFKSRLQQILVLWGLVTEMRQSWLILVGDFRLTNLLIQLSTVASEKQTIHSYTNIFIEVFDWTCRLKNVGHSIQTSTGCSHRMTTTYISQLTWLLGNSCHLLHHIHPY